MFTAWAVNVFPLPRSPTSACHPPRFPNLTEQSRWRSLFNASSAAWAEEPPHRVMWKARSRTQSGTGAFSFYQAPLPLFLHLLFFDFGRASSSRKIPPGFPSKAIDKFIAHPLSGYCLFFQGCSKRYNTVRTIKSRMNHHPRKAYALPALFLAACRDSCYGATTAGIPRPTGTTG